MAGPPSPEDVPLGELPEPDAHNSPTKDDLKSIVLSDSLKAVDRIYGLLDGSKFNPHIQALMADEGLWALHNCTDEELHERGFPYREYFIDVILRKVTVEAYMSSNPESPESALFAWQFLEPYVPVIERAAFPELTACTDNPERSPNPGALRDAVRIVRENAVASINHMLEGALDVETMEEFLHCIRIGEEAAKIFGRNAATRAQAALCNERTAELNEIAIVLEAIELALLKATDALANGKLAVAIRETANVRAEEESLVRDMGDKPLLRELQQEYLQGLYDRMRALPGACFRELRRSEQQLERHVSRAHALDDRPFDRAVRDVVRLYRLIEEILPDEEEQLDHVRLIAVLELIMEARDALSLTTLETAQEAASAIVEVRNVREYFTQSLALIFRTDEERLHAPLESRVLEVAQVLEDCETLLIEAAGVLAESIDLTEPPSDESQT